MKHSLSQIQQAINSANTIDHAAVKCQSCGSKIKPHNLKKHAECQSYSSFASKPFLNRESIPTEIKIKKPRQMQPFMVGNERQGYQGIAPPINKHILHSLIISEPQPDQPIRQKQAAVIGGYDYSSTHQERQATWMEQVLNERTQKQNVETLSVLSKDKNTPPTSARIVTTQRTLSKQGPSALSTTTRSKKSLQEEITYRHVPSVKQLQKQKYCNPPSNQSTSSMNLTGLLSIFSCMSNHGAQNRTIYAQQRTRPGECSCCHRANHQPPVSSSQIANNFQMQKKKILYDRWLQARSRYQSMPTISFEQAFKRHRFLKQHQFSSMIRGYFV